MVLRYLVPIRQTTAHRINDLLFPDERSSWRRCYNSAQAHVSWERFNFDIRPRVPVASGGCSLLATYATARAAFSHMLPKLAVTGIAQNGRPVPRFLEIGGMFTRTAACLIHQGRRTVTFGYPAYARGRNVGSRWLRGEAPLDQLGARCPCSLGCPNEAAVVLFAEGVLQRRVAHPRPWNIACLHKRHKSVSGLGARTLLALVSGCAGKAPVAVQGLQSTSGNQQLSRLNDADRHHQ